MKMQKKSMNSPDEVRNFPKGKLKLVNFEGITYGLATFKPGWRWSTSIKPMVKTESCQAPHTNYHLSGRMAVKMDDGSKAEFGPGDIGVIPPGHDAWVIGKKPVVVIDITGMVNYAKKAK